MSQVSACNVPGTAQANHLYSPAAQSTPQPRAGSNSASLVIIIVIVIVVLAGLAFLVRGFRRGKPEKQAG